MDDLVKIDAALCSIVRGEPDIAVQWPDHTPEDLIWARIGFHGIVGILDQNSDQFADWPADLRERIRQESRLIGLWEETHKQCVTAMLQAVASSNVETILMKGTALAYTHYTDPALRRRGDTDLLVRKQDLKSIRATLANLGWSRREQAHGLIYQETWLFDTGARFVHELDLHWQPIDSPLLQSVLRIEEFFANPRSVARLSDAAFTCSPIHTLVQLALNQAWHRTRGLAVDGAKVVGGWRLIWACDYDLLLRDFDEAEWSQLVQISQDRNITPIIGQSIDSAARSLSTPIPTWVRDELKKQPIDKTVTHYLSHPDLIAEFEINFRAAKTIREKLRLFWVNAFPLRGHLVMKYPSMKNWPTIALHGRRIFETIKRTGRQHR
ncbi:MAG: nucleotidyltransferase family protein [Erythrobacter sp.]